MTVRRLAAVDAQTYWMSARVPSDQFLLYAFDGPVADPDRALSVVRDRARQCHDLGVRVADTEFWRYPRWAPREVGVEQIVVHELADATWRGCLAAVAGLVGDQVDARVMTWRLHVFPTVARLPGAATGSVVVLQICHALGDGVRASALAANLLGRPGSVPALAAHPARVIALPLRAFDAGRAYRRLVRETEAGMVPPQAVSRPPLRSNARPAGAAHLRSVVCARERFDGTTVTVGALAAISAALAGHLRELGEDPAQLGAEVPMAKAGPRLSYNHFGNVGVGLYPDQDLPDRLRSIAADLHRRRRRSAHPAMAAEAAAQSVLPAPLLRWGVGKFDPEARSSTVTGNTVVSSVNRGAKELYFGDARVVFTAGFPTLSPMMGVTHGVHGIGDTVAVSVHAADSAIGDIDAYVARLERELLH